jgi:DNA ligase (NAD+)
MLKKDFESLNARQRAEGKPEFANPRNLAAGTIRQLDPALVASRPLSFRGYDLLREDASEVPTNMYAYEAMTELGIFRSPEATIFKSVKGVMDFVHEWDKKRHELPYNTDGLVIKVNNRAQFDSLGIVGKQPRGAVAYKYAAEQATTIVQDIVISIGGIQVSPNISFYRIQNVLVTLQGQGIPRVTSKNPTGATIQNLHIQ